MGLGRMARGAALAIVACVSSNAAQAELAKWNQERITKYAEELKVTTADLVRALATVNVAGVTVKDQYYQARETVSMMQHASDGLAAALKSGEGREATLPRFKRIELLRRDAEAQAREAELSNDVLGKIISVGDVLFRLRPYYQEEPMPGEPKAP